MQSETVIFQRLTDGANQHHILDPADDAVVGILEYFNTTATAILGCLAGGLGAGQCM